MGATAGGYDGPNTDVSGTFDTTEVDASAATTVEGVAEVFENDGSEAPDVLVADAEAVEAEVPAVVEEAVVEEPVEKPTRSTKK